MEKKKLIGTIIGVIAFAALIAGATYAWLTFSLGVNNGNYNLGTMNFNVDYQQGTAITSLPTLTSGDPSTAGSLTVRAKKASNSAPGDLTIYLNTDLNSTSSALLASGAINYAVCVGTCSSFDSITTKGTLTSSTPAKLAILTGSPLTTDYTNYNVYFWLDGALVTNELVSGNASYTGWISAEATQVDTRARNS